MSRQPRIFSYDENYQSSTDEKHRKMLLDQEKEERNNKPQKQRRYHPSGELLKQLPRFQIAVGYPKHTFIFETLRENPKLKKIIIGIDGNNHVDVTIVKIKTDSLYKIESIVVHEPNRTDNGISNL